MKLKNKSISTIIILTYFLIFSFILGATYLISFYIFSKNIKETSNELMLETTNQITYNYEKYISSILEVSELVEDRTIQDENNNYQGINSFIDLYLSTNQEILSMQIYSLDGTLLASDSNSELLPNIIHKEWFINAITDSTIHYITPITDENKNYDIRFSKVISIDKQNNKALLTLEIDFQDIIDLNYKTNLGEGGHIIIVDDKYQVIYSSNEELKNEEIQLIKDTVIGTTSYQNENSDYSVFLNNISNSRWRIAIFYNIDQVGVALNNFLFLISFITFIIFIIGSSIILLVSRQITNPLKKLEKTMSTIDKSIPLAYADVNGGSKEIISLAKTYNQMIGQINTLMDQVILEQKNQRKSELKALQNQINPHFLYNTLDSIVWLIENDKKDDAQKMVIALAKLFRISISRGRSIIPVKDEIDHVRNYLYIQSMRYTDSFEYQIQIDEECYKYQVMKLILQPLVENSIYHGLKNKIDKGLILITGHMENNNLILTVEDNGYGITSDKIEGLYRKFNDPNLNDGVGLKNVYQRLHIYYGDRSYLKIVSEIDEGTKIIISIPVEEINNETK